MQRTRHSRDDGVVVAGEKVQLADRSGLVFGHAVVRAVEDGELTLEGFEAIPEGGRFRISSGLTLDAWVIGVPWRSGRFVWNRRRSGSFCWRPMKAGAR